MPPIAIPAAVKLVLGTIGAAAVVHWVVKEVRRVASDVGAARRGVDEGAPLDHDPIKLNRI